MAAAAPFGWQPDNFPLQIKQGDKYGRQRWPVAAVIACNTTQSKLAVATTTMATETAANTTCDCSREGWGRREGPKVVLTAEAETGPLAPERRSGHGGPGAARELELARELTFSRERARSRETQSPWQLVGQLAALARPLVTSRILERLSGRSRRLLASRSLSLSLACRQSSSSHFACCSFISSVGRSVSRPTSRERKVTLATNLPRLLAIKEKGPRRLERHCQVLWALIGSINLIIFTNSHLSFELARGICGRASCRAHSPCRRRRRGRPKCIYWPPLASVAAGPTNFGLDRPNLL